MNNYLGKRTEEVQRAGYGQARHQMEVCPNAGRWQPHLNSRPEMRTPEHCVPTPQTH